MARNETRARFSGVLFATGLRRNTASWREADVRREAAPRQLLPKADLSERGRLPDETEAKRREPAAGFLLA